MWTGAPVTNADRVRGRGDKMRSCPERREGRGTAGRQRRKEIGTSPEKDEPAGLNGRSLSLPHPFSPFALVRRAPRALRPMSRPRKGGAVGLLRSADRWLLVNLLRLASRDFTQRKTLRSITGKIVRDRIHNEDMKRSRKRDG